METLEMIQEGFGDQSLSRKQVFQWHARFNSSICAQNPDRWPEAAACQRLH